MLTLNPVYLFIVFVLTFRTYLVIPELTKELEVWQSRQGLSVLITQAFHLHISLVPKDTQS